MSTKYSTLNTHTQRINQKYKKQFIFKGFRKRCIALQMTVNLRSK